MFQPTINIAFRIKSIMIKVNVFSEENLFQIIKTDNELNTKIIVQANTINELEGVHSGRLIVLYQAFPTSAKYEAAEAVIKTNSGISK